MKYALKEWNTTVEALGKGQVVAVWRKGGIDDKPNIKEPYESFKVEQNQFILYPTFTHQGANKIKEDFLYLFDLSSGPNKDNQVKIKYWAEIEEVITVETVDQLLNVSSELVNNSEHLVSSWNLYPNHRGKILVLRVYSLSDPILITNSLEYTGCKSWIELKIDIPKSGSRAILPFKEFSRKVRLIKALLEQTQTTEKVLVS